MIIAEIFITGTAFAGTIAGMALFVLALILALRKFYTHQNSEKLFDKYGQKNASFSRL